MRDEQKFFQLLKPLRRRLLWETILKYGQIFFLLCSGIWFIWRMLGRSFFIVHLKIWLPVLFFLAFVYCAICFFRDKPSWYQTVLIMNEFIPDDLVLTAYSVLTKEGELERLIARAANRTIPRYLEQALKRKKRCVSFPQLEASLLFISGGFLPYLFPK